MPAPTLTGGADQTQLLAAQNEVAGTDINNQESMQLGQMNSTYTKETVPQLQSGIASGGAWYGSARQTAEGTAARHFQDSAADVISQGQRSLDDLQRQQVYATLGLIL